MRRVLSSGVAVMQGREDVLFMTRILIADDHDVVRSGLSTILGGQPGWEVVAEAEDGRQAVQLAAETKPDVAILDYQLPLDERGRRDARDPRLRSRRPRC